MQAYNRFGEELPRFASLGIKKLLIASRLPDCVEYVKQHEEEIVSSSAQELEKQVRQLRQKGKKKGRSGRKPEYLEFGKVRIRSSRDGTRLSIEGINKSKQDEIMEAVIALLSHKRK